MSPTYNQIPAVDENFNFPPEVKTALTESVEMTNAIIDIVSEDPVVAGAAAEAVDTAIEGLSLVQTKDASLLREIPSTEYALPFTDKDGYVAGGVQTDGRFNFEKYPKVKGQSDITLRPVSEFESLWAIPFVDKDGYVAGGIRPDGTAEFQKLKVSPENALNILNQAIGYSRSNRNRVACFGDSLTVGYFDGTSVGKIADSYPSKLAEKLGSKVEVFNLGTSGWTVDEISAKVGALPLPLTVTNNTIPTSGSVSVTTTATIGWGSSGTRTMAGSLLGIQGSLVRVASSPNTFNFTRTTAGNEVVVPPNTIFVPEYAGHDADTAVVMFGRNDVSNNVVGVENSIPLHILNGAKRLVKWLSRDIKQVLVMSVTTNTAEVIGTAGYNNVVATNALLAAEFGPKFFDLRRYLIDKAIYDLGITPTADDLSKIAGDTLPPSIMDGGATGSGDITHYSRATANLVGQKVFEYLTTRDWVTQ